MHDGPISKTGFFAALLVSALFTFLAYFLNVDDGSFVVFCDVGQGDAIYIHLRPDFDILIDAGKGSSVLNCLGKYMSINDRTIELAFITHLQNDHYGGFLQIPLKYRIERLYLSEQRTSSEGVKLLMSMIKDKNVQIKPIYSEDSLTVLGATFQMLWPTEEYVQASTEKSNSNDSSQIMLFSYNKHTILFTGDASPKSLKMLLQQSVPKVEILKVPHHGSKNGLIDEFLFLADPTYSVISAGKNNSYGHPSPEIINMLTENGSEILRTDELGDVVFKLD